MSSRNDDGANVDNQVRRLLDPKSFLKDKAKKKAGKAAAVLETTSRPTIDKMVFDSPSSVSPSSNLKPSSGPPHSSYDPKALLNPKGARKQMSRDDRSSSPYTSSAASRNLPNGLSAESLSGAAANGGVQATATEGGSGGRSMLEGLYGVEHRTEQPRKKLKPSVDDEDAREGKQSFNIRSNGLVGQYLKPQSGTVPLATSTLVDLTTDADEDDIQITGSRNILEDEEVCFGNVVAVILAYLTPKPKKDSTFTSSTDWPAMKCTLSREPSKENTVIDVIDPCGKTFGRIESELAMVLAPVMDGLRKLRTQPRLINRRKKENEWPHQPCSEQLKMFMNIYGRRGDAERIGKVFGQHNIWFRPPVAPDGGISTCNPHAQRNCMVPRHRETGRGVVMAETRTTEEAAQAVSKLFDHFAADSAPLKSTESPDEIVTPLLEHQKQALTFLLQHEKPREYGSEEAENSSLWRIEHRKEGRKLYREVVAGLTLNHEPEQVYGGLLADVMGLGKTLEALALIVSTLNEASHFSKEKVVRNGPDDASFLSHTRATLLVSPLSTIKNWEDQIADHVKANTLKMCVYHGPNRIDNPHLLADHDIVITTYGTIAADFSNKSPRQDLSPIRRLKWFRIILDEAHTIREPRAAQSQAIYSLWAQRRWCLTGTPIQNRIDDLGSLTRFLRLYPYDEAARFNQYIRSPAAAGDPAFLKSLRVFVDSFTLRRLKDRVDLPHRQDLIVTLEMSSEERKMHDFFKELSHVQIEEISKQKKARSGIQHHVLQGIMTLRLICAHGRELLKEKDLAKLKGLSPAEAIDLEEVHNAPTLTKRAALEAYSLMAEASVDLCRQCDKQLSVDSPGIESEDGKNGVRCHVLPCLDVICNDCFEPFKDSFDNRSDKELVTCPFCSMAIGSQYVSLTGSTAEELETAPDDLASPEQDTEPQYYGGPHTKTRALLADIEDMETTSKPLISRGEPPIKCVVFSEFTSHLNLIERAIHDSGRTFVRIDGSMSLNKRKKVLDALSTDNSVTILLASIKAAGQGLNLTACSRAFIMEPMWNPAAEAQAVDRIYRIGQSRDVIVKRYQMKDSIEIKIVELQRKKQALADISMNRNHKALSKQEVREQHMRDIKALFA